MTNIKSQFSSEEWMKVMTGAGNAGSAIVAASPSGVTGLIAEMGAIVKGVREEVGKEPRTPLLEAIAADLVAGPPEGLQQDSEGRIKNMEEAVSRALQGVREALYLVDSKASPEEAQSYRTMLQTVAQRVAEAAKEGGFLGMGGEQINDKERQVLAQLDELMGSGGQISQAAGLDTGSTVSPNPDGSGNSV
ncbi:hypothetical protein [Deinococcus radiophilus]|uniref:Uncharacterized protein n=1 Tax=Deinococcus radiophilus TaxID=32062 RepID=A0A431VX58_9DEIO|nr:hypothetical protein [Deinococcus radiophilus]RTR27780.1 hypothetical protein EJ104_06270 [Deinococcus radiophilus]UFA50102.1 hypothetical protein LMT64_09490 [Deinococcus radiophilus]